MTDEHIIDKVLEGNTHIFSEIVDKYKGKVFNMVYRFTNDSNESQDLSQEVFIKTFKSLEMFNNESKFSTWLYRICYNVCIDWCRKNKKNKKQLYINSVDNEIIDSRLNVEDNYMEKQKNIALGKAVRGLKEKYSTVLILYHYQGLSYEEIGDILKIPVKTVETRLYRGRKLLKDKFYQDYYGGELGELQTGC